MNTSPILTWLLGGALVASLGWNLTASHATREALHQVADVAGSPPTCPPGAWPGCDTTSCELSTDLDLGLDGPQVRALGDACETTCGQVDELDAQAERALGELWHRVADPSAGDAEVERLLQRVLDLRARSLRTCVEGALAIRAALAPDQARRLFERCCAAESAAGAE